MTTLVILAGNPDQRLTDPQWGLWVGEIRATINNCPDLVSRHGEWKEWTTEDQRVTACWAVDVTRADRLRQALHEVHSRYQGLRLGVVEGEIERAWTG